MLMIRRIQGVILFRSCISTDLGGSSK